MVSRRIKNVIFPITSANQHGSRYNPVPLYVRIAGLERTFSILQERFDISISYVPVPHIVPQESFASFIIKHCEAELDVMLSPEEVLVWTSTDTLISQFSKLGYAILPAEWDIAHTRYHALPPTHIIAQLVTQPWGTDNPAYQYLSAGTRSLWNDMPVIPAHIIRLWNDPLLTDSGSLTDTRNYGVYTVGMGNTDVLDLKYTDIKNLITEGKIVDEGCADGALMVRLANDFPDSDIIGIDITGEFVARVEERQRSGDFGKAFVHVYQRNILEPIFAPNTINTVICNSTLHEIWSYAAQETSIRSYLADKYTQLAPLGKLVIRDVVGTPESDKTVYLKLRTDDGLKLEMTEMDELLAADTRTLSTYTKWFRFVNDFLADMRVSGKREPETKITYTLEQHDGVLYIACRLKDAYEFLSRKDYHDNWNSEMNEEFGFWDFTRWQRELSNVGFKVLQEESRVYQNEWIVENRWKPCVEIYAMTNKSLTLHEYPLTTMVLVGEKPNIDTP